LSVLYFVRHGQAGTREHYDSLSELGRDQALRLGEYLRGQGIQFDRAISGSLSRQRATGAAVLEAIGGGTPGIGVDRGWDEFDLQHVYREMAPCLVRDDADFARQYEEMQRALAESQGAHHAPVHRKWNDCDRKAVRAWVEGRYPFTGETWVKFVERIHGALARAIEIAADGNAIVFTSATPIGVSAARALEIEDGRAMWMAAVLFNASLSSLRIHEGDVRLFTFNMAAHLDSAELRTFR
jgi:broad specificity phosphatase PhoE